MRSAADRRDRSAARPPRAAPAGTSPRQRGTESRGRPTRLPRASTSRENYTCRTDKICRVQTNALRELVDDCVHCGFCLPACPTYLLWGREADSPRGRIYLMKASLEGRPVVDETFRTHIDSCLGCMSCVTASLWVFNSVRLIEPPRPRFEAPASRPWIDRAYRSLLFAILPRPKRLRPLATLLAIVQRLGIQRLARAIALTALLPPRLA